MVVPLDVGREKIDLARTMQPPEVQGQISLHLCHIAVERKTSGRGGFGEP